MRLLRRWLLTPGAARAQSPGPAGLGLAGRLLGLRGGRPAPSDPAAGGHPGTALGGHSDGGPGSDPGRPAGTAGPALLRAQDLSVGYHEHPVCAPASFTLLPGQALALVGINGAGKSTLLRTCCGLLPAVRGRVEILGALPDPRSDSQRAQVAVDLGEASFFPSLSVEEHLRLVCFGHGVPQAEEAVQDMLVELDLMPLARALPDQLSSGQRRRVALAAVLLRPRRLLVLDEPEQRLDHLMRLELAGRLIEEREAGGAVLMASHDPDLVAAAATRVLLVGHDTRLMGVAEGVAAMRQGE